MKNQHKVLKQNGHYLSQKQLGKNVRAIRLAKAQMAIKTGKKCLPRGSHEAKVQTKAKRIWMETAGDRRYR